MQCPWYSGSLLHSAVIRLLDCAHIVLRRQFLIVSHHLPLSACSRGLTWCPSATAGLFDVLHCLSSSANVAETWCWAAYVTDFCSLRTAQFLIKGGMVECMVGTKAGERMLILFCPNRKWRQQDPNASFPCAGWIPESLAGLAHWTALPAQLLCSYSEWQQQVSTLRILGLLKSLLNQVHHLVSRVVFQNMVMLAFKLQEQVEMSEIVVMCPGRLASA